MDNEYKMPELTFGKGTSGLEIRAEFDFSPNCVEFTLKKNYPLPVFISPWIQFEDPKFAEARSKIAIEIIRRAAAWDSVQEELARLRQSEKYWKDSYYQLKEKPPSSPSSKENK